MSLSTVSLVRRSLVAALAVILAGGAMATTSHAQSTPAAPGAGRAFEMRTYYTHPGRLEALNKRFRDHTSRLFKKHGMEIVGYWTPTDKPEVLVYILAYPSRDAAKKSWDAFRADPEWTTARTASEVDGPIVLKVESVYMSATDYSPMK